MARKKTRKRLSRKPSDTSTESTLKKLQTQLTDPRITQWLWSGARGVRERIMRLNYDVLRGAVDRLPLINGIINTRVDQIMPYCQYAEEEGDRGYELVLLDRSMPESEYSDREVDDLVKFINQTGFEYDPEREDDFSDFVGMMIRELLVIDQIGTEIQFNRAGDARAFWLLDGATLRRVTDESDFARGVRFVQEIETQIYNEYTADMLIFDYKFKRADIRYRGYGYSPVEQALDIITTLLFGYNYIRDQLIKDHIPRGFISVMGDVGKPEMDAIRSYWWTAMSGAGASFNIPILPSGKDGVGVDFKMIGHNNRDMEFHRTLMFVSSLIGSVFSIDLLELGIKTDDTQAVIGESSEPRISSSKDRGLHALLMFIQQYMNKILLKVGEKYKFRFAGMVEEDYEKQASIRSKEIAAWRCIDEIREEDGLEPFKEDWSKMPLHPQAVQIFLQDKQAKKQEEMMEQGGGDFGGFGGNGGEQQGNNLLGQGEEAKGTSEEKEEEEESIKKSLRALAEFQKATRVQEKVIRHVIQ